VIRSGATGVSTLCGESSLGGQPSPDKLALREAPAVAGRDALLHIRRSGRGADPDRRDIDKRISGWAPDRAAAVPGKEFVNGRTIGASTTCAALFRIEANASPPTHRQFAVKPRESP
jgi:hypothetical protein